METPHRNNIGLLRYLLALAVFAHHANVLTGTHLPAPARLAVGLFFALSGYFGWRSAAHAPSARAYLLRRGRRLLIPYWAAVVFFAVTLVCVSQLPPSVYFTSAEWWRYLAANLLTLNFAQPTLPGVFAGLEAGGAVNGALWFVKVEIALSLLAPLMARGTATRRRPWLVPTLVYALCAATLYLAGDTLSQARGSIVARHIWYLQMYAAGAACSACGLCSLPSRRLWCAAGAGLWLLSLYLPVLSPLLAAAPAVAAMVAFGCTDGASALNRHNISYTLFLVHFPLLQCATLAQRHGWWNAPWLSAALALAASLALAAVLHFVTERNGKNRAQKAEKA